MLIDSQKHHVLLSAHPSPHSADKGFFGCKDFSRTNEILKQGNKTPIDWYNHYCCTDIPPSFPFSTESRDSSAALLLINSPAKVTSSTIVSASLSSSSAKSIKPLSDQTCECKPTDTTATSTMTCSTTEEPESATGHKISRKRKRED